MAAPHMHKLAERCVHPIHQERGLPRVVRHIAGHNAEGKSVFLSKDSGNYHRELVNTSAITNIIYSTSDNPVGLNGDGDIKYAQENEPALTLENGSICRMIDFAPGSVSPMNFVDSLYYAIVIEGVFRMILDSGEERIMQRGDIAVQQSTAHRWVNVTGNGLLPARILFVPLDINHLRIGGENVKRELGVLRKDYVKLPGHGGKDKPDSGRIANFYENDFFESEF